MSADTKTILTRTAAESYADRRNRESNSTDYMAFKNEDNDGWIVVRFNEDCTITTVRG